MKNEVVEGFSQQLTLLSEQDIEIVGRSALAHEIIGEYHIMSPLLALVCGLGHVKKKRYFLK